MIAPLPADSPQQARRTGERAADMIRRLWDENERLRERIKQWEVFDVAAIQSDSPGYPVWHALMEDLRAEGVMQMQVRSHAWLEIGYTPASPDEKGNPE